MTMARIVAVPRLSSALLVPTLASSTFAAALTVLTLIRGGRVRPFQHRRNDALGCSAVAVRIGSCGHFSVGLSIGQEFFQGSNDAAFVSANKARSSDLNAFRAFGYVPGHQNRNIQCRRLLLHSTAIGNDEKRSRHEMDEVEIVKRFDEHKVLRTT